MQTPVMSVLTCHMLVYECRRVAPVWYGYMWHMCGCVMWVWCLHACVCVCCVCLWCVRVRSAHVWCGVYGMCSGYGMQIHGWCLCGVMRMHARMLCVMCAGT